MIANPNNKLAEEGRFGFGTTEAVDALFRKLRLTRDTSALVAINIDTLIRNAVGNKQAVAGQVVDKVRQTMQGIANEFGDICHEKWRDKPHHIVFYLANTAKAVPASCQRPRNSPTQLLIDNATRLLIKVLHNGDQEDKNVFAHVRMTDTMKVPSYKGLNEVIKSFSLPNVELHLISHMPMDYHVTLISNRPGWLYRSHTGEVVKMTPDALGKTVFKLDTVPFYPVTHVLLGDKYLIKPSVDAKAKRMLIGYATKEHWIMHANLYVRSKIKDYNFVLPFSLD